MAMALGLRMTGCSGLGERLSRVLLEVLVAAS